ncbi:hypothetical protein B4099_3117 [Heyndrickxia coagulans]|uniref:Uncharacterized protein n=1 Tax=Heyndrickxia coagulans TaxID=1398 RepID=A0A150KHZ7_HEYCO|nr:hypothetical protein B4099_3117 [Heyndrickxia coagulans]
MRFFHSRMCHPTEAFFPKITRDTRFPGLRQWKKAQEACKSPANRLIIRYIQH